MTYLTDDPSDDIAFWSTSEQAAAIRSGMVGSLELMDHLIDRIEKINPELNAVITSDYERARAAASSADEVLARGENLGPLHGVPITVKDALETEGIISTGGATELATNVPNRDAPVVAAVKAAGAIVMAKTNLPRWSGDIQAYNDLFGTTVNPWDVERVPGGSSGGAAAAVAAGLTSFEIGTDIGGSIRFPASFNGIYGHKPSFGIVPSTGYLDHVDGGTTEADVNVIGPLARSAADLDLLLGILARSTPPWVAQLDPPAGDVRQLRVAAWLDDEFCPVDDQVLAVMEAAVGLLEADGVAVDRGARPDLDPAVASSLGAELVVQAIMQSTKSEGIGHRLWLDKHMEREALRARWAEFFTRFDVILMPVAFVPPFPHQQDGNFATRTLMCNGVERPYADVVRWTFLTGMAYLPSSVPPLGLTAGGLPVGLQVVGPYGSDRSTIALAGHIGSLTGGYRRPPLS